MAETAREFIQGKLVIGGFAVEETPEGMRVWPRGMDPNEISFIIAEQKGKFVAVSGKGRFGTKRMRRFMDLNLEQWRLQHELKMT